MTGLQRFDAEALSRNPGAPDASNGGDSVSVEALSCGIYGALFYVL
jgi:hypothetical protein